MISGPQTYPAGGQVAIIFVFFPVTALHCMLFANTRFPPAVTGSGTVLNIGEFHSGFVWMRLDEGWESESGSGNQKPAVFTAGFVLMSAMGASPIRPEAVLRARYVRCANYLYSFSTALDSLSTSHTGRLPASNSLLISQSIIVPSVRYRSAGLTGSLSVLLPLASRL